MIDLREQEHDALRQLARAGAHGLPLAEVGASAAIRMELLGLVLIGEGDPQTVTITSKGTAFQRRTVFA